ncbi:hypothetical protein WKK05_41690 (plasmid) [Nostoc sp. UHCC 0302]|uniref:hypothetical protein n=1 Tax=Nostoc sp. UHCC 0302 TaxID=3134896 RepID=UPI00311CA9B9
MPTKPQLLPHQESSFGIAPKTATLTRAHIRAIHLSLKGVSTHSFRRTARAEAKGGFCDWVLGLVRSGAEKVKYM